MKRVKETHPILLATHDLPPRKPKPTTLDLVRAAGSAPRVAKLAPGLHLVRDGKNPIVVRPDGTPVEPGYKRRFQATLATTQGWVDEEVAPMPWWKFVLVAGTTFGLALGAWGWLVYRT